MCAGLCLGLKIAAFGGAELSGKGALGCAAIARFADGSVAVVNTARRSARPDSSKPFPDLMAAGDLVTQSLMHTSLQACCYVCVVVV